MPQGRRPLTCLAIRSAPGLASEARRCQRNLPATPTDLGVSDGTSPNTVYAGHDECRDHQGSIRGGPGQPGAPQGSTVDLSGDGAQDATVIVGAASVGVQRG